MSGSSQAHGAAALKMGKLPTIMYGTPQSRTHDQVLATMGAAHQSRSTKNSVLRRKLENLMKFIVFAYGVVSYAMGVASLLYLICFLNNTVVSNTIDAAPDSGIAHAVLVDLVLVGLFALQHSIMARPGFKALWTRIVPKPAERSTYVLATSLVLALLFWQWLPLSGLVWNVENAVGKGLLQALFWLGWVITFASTFMINHFDLFGLRQVYLRLKDEPYQPVPFVKRAFYRFVRHPIMLGLLIGFWATPTMSWGHLLFAAASTVYIFAGIALEEHDTHQALGEGYARYRRETSMILPLSRGKF
jgi:methanethiol S-methyltransferase